MKETKNLSYFKKQIIYFKYKIAIAKHLQKDYNNLI